MIVVAFDTNVLASAIFSPQGNEARAIGLWHAGLIDIALTAEMLAEYQAVLARPKFKLDPAKVSRFLEPFVQHSKVRTLVSLSISPHDSDNRFLECVEAADADFLVTGNLRHFPPTHGRTRIVNARTFITLVDGKL